MNWKTLDHIRRRSGPVHVDLVESYAQGKISRRNFIRRGVIVGLSTPAMAAVIAACGDDSEDETTAEPASGGGEAVQGGNLNVAVQFGDANSGLDPLNMLDLGTYGVLSQSFEYLVGLGEDGNIAPTSLATGWSPNEDGTVWTFELREGVTWQDGSEFTSADVAATFDRMAAVGAGVAGVLSEGSTDASDPTRAVVTLDSANGNFPVLVSIFNPQSLITPADYSSGTTLDGRAAGTGAWILDSFDATTFTTTFVPNENWWGGSVNLDTLTLRGFESIGTAVSAMQAREVDMVQQFNVIDGSGLLEDPNFNVLKPPAANHRQLWFNTQGDGQYTDPRVRQALALTLNREQMVATLFEGQGIVANDHPVHPSLPFFDESAVEQRGRDVEMARQLLADAGFPDGITGDIQVGNLQEIPDMAAIVQQNAAEAGFNLNVAVTDNSDFYGAHWCPGGEEPGLPCGPSAEVGIVDYGHRPTPDIFFGRALATDGDWNSSNYSSPDFDQLFTDYQSSIDVEGQTTAVSSIQQLLHDDTPAAYAFFFDYLSGHDTSVSGVQVTALGHMLFQNASKSS